MSAWMSLATSLPGRCDGIGDNAWHLARALGAYGQSELRVRLAVHRSTPLGARGRQAQDPIHLTSGTFSPGSVENGSDPLRSWRDLSLARAAEIDGVVLHYYPGGFVRRDLPPLLRWLSAVRRHGAAVVLVIHEFWPPADGRWRRAASRALYRRVLRTLIARASHVVVSHALAARELAAAGLVDEHAARIIPVGSNIDRRPAAGPPIDHSLVMFGQPAGMHREALVALGTWLSTKGVMARLHWIGRSADELRAAWCGDYGLPSHRVTFDGGLASDDVSAILSASGLGLAPYVDGASTRRSSLAALFAHGLPLVGLDGPCTDDVVRTSGALLLSDRSRPEAFVANVATALAEDAARVRLSSASDRFFSSYLAWPRIAEQYLAMLAPVSPAVSL